MKPIIVPLSTFVLVAFVSILNSQDFGAIVENLHSLNLQQISSEGSSTNVEKPNKSDVPIVEEEESQNSATPIFEDVLNGQKEIWTSPFRIRSQDLLWVGPLLGATAVLLVNDKQINDSFDPSQQTLDRSRKVSYLGSIPVLAGTAGAVYLAGKITKNDHTTKTGYLGLMALLHTTIVIQGLKVATGRVRPDEGDSSGNFWSGGYSFPSGHSASAWALAAVFTEQYPRNHWLQFGAYGIATAVSVSRFTGEKHFASDVLVGSALGYLIGRLVVSQHSTTIQSKPLESLTPYFNRKEGKYGMEMSFRW